MHVRPKPFHLEPSHRKTAALLGVLSLAAASALLLINACQVQPDAPKADRQLVLQDLTSNVILPLFMDVASQAAQLATATTALRQTPSAATLANAQQAYRTARSAQKMTDALYYAMGPADDVAVTAGAIDAWPADATKIEALISGTANLTPTDVTLLGASQRGFAALEQLLFDSSVSDADVLARYIEPPTGARRLELTESLAFDLAALTKKVSDAFSAPDGYGFELANAGLGAKVLNKQIFAIDKVLTGLLYGSELMQMRKLANPLGVDNNKTHSVSPSYEEAPRSDSTLADLQANLAGMSAIYSGQYGAHSGAGISTAVHDVNPSAGARFEQTLAAAVAAVNAVPPPFRTTLLRDPTPIMAAYNAVTALEGSISNDLAIPLGASLGFSYSDSD